MQELQYKDQVVPLSKLRRVLEVMYPSVQRKPMIHALTEVDVTNVRTYLREYKANTGESLSFTAFIITCFAHAIATNPSLHACRKGSKHLMLFAEVDVATAIERDMTGQKQPIVYIIRAANTKSFHEIHHEIRTAQIETVEKVWEGFSAALWLQHLPMFLLRIFWWIFCWLRWIYPKVQKKYGGTVGVTAVGMFGNSAGWGIPINDHTIDLTLGGIAQKPGVVNGQIAIREYLSITVSFDHTIIDGAPAVCFTQQLKELIESGYGLSENDAETITSDRAGEEMSRTVGNRET